MKNIIILLLSSFLYTIALAQPPEANPIQIENKPTTTTTPKPTLTKTKTSTKKDDEEQLEKPKSSIPSKPKPTTPAPKPATKPKPTTTTTKPTTPTWKSNFDKKFPILKNEEKSYLPQTMIDKYTTLLNTLPNTSNTEKELIYARIELLKTKIDKDSDGDGFTDKNDNCPNQYATNNNGCPRNGYFTVTYTDGDKYEGNFINDKYEGKGLYILANGNKYDGEFLEGKKSGFGKFTWANGDKYEGNWKDNNMHDYGIYTIGSSIGYINYCPECVKYDGQWINGKKDGMGSCYDKKGIIIYSGKFKDDKPVYTYPMKGLNDLLNSDAIKIGTQTWSAKNLDVAYFRNGDPIPEVKTNEEWKKAGENKQPAWCYYNNDPANGKKYGKLYNWYAVNDSRGLAPAGWHIPSDKEWQTLIDFLGGEDVAGGKMKSTLYWESPNKGATNSSGFTGLPGAARHENGYFSYVELYSEFWSSTENNSSDYAWNRSLSYDYSIANRNYEKKKNGFSVRCVMD